MNENNIITMKDIARDPGGKYRHGEQSFEGQP